MASGGAREVRPPDAGPRHPGPREAGATRTGARAGVSAVWLVVAFGVRAVVGRSWGGVLRNGCGGGLIPSIGAAGRVQGLGGGWAGVAP